MKTTAKRITTGAAALTLVLFANLSVATADTNVERSPIGQMAHRMNPVNWRMPEWKLPNLKQLLPANEEKARIRKKKDGLFEEVSKSASNSWNKTKQALNPQRLNPIKFFPASSRTPSPGKRGPARPGFLRSLFGPPAPRENENETVTDFLRQSRPGP